MKRPTITLDFLSNNERQLEAAGYWVDGITEQVLYGGAKGGGKSYLGCSLIFGAAFTYPGTHYFIARKELNDLRKYTIPSINEVFRDWKKRQPKFDPIRHVSFNGQDNIYNLHNGSRVYLISCAVEPSDPLFERFGSMQMTGGWIEEAGEITESAKSNLWLSIGRWRNDEYGLKKKLLLTANPKKGFLKREFIDPWKGGELFTDKKFVQAFATDNPYLSQDYLRSLSEEKDQVRRQRLWLGDWEYDEDKDSMISLEALSDAFTNTIVKDAHHYLIVDVARFGEDHSVYTFWEGLECYRIERFNGNDIEETKAHIRQYAISERIPYSQICIDEANVGGGVVDGLKGVRGFVSSSAPIPTAAEIRGKLSAKLDHPLIPRRNFSNLKAQAAYKLAELINEHRILFAVPQYRDMITEDLAALLRYKHPDSDGKIQLKDKEEVKRELNRSPDVGDSIIMRMFFELAKDMHDEDPMIVQVRREQVATFNMNKGNQRLNSTK